MELQEEKEEMPDSITFTDKIDKTDCSRSSHFCLTPWNDFLLYLR